MVKFIKLEVRKQDTEISDCEHNSANLNKLEVTICDFQFSKITNCDLKHYAKIETDPLSFLQLSTLTSEQMFTKIGYQV